MKQQRHRKLGKLSKVAELGNARAQIQAWPEFRAHVLVKKILLHLSQCLFDDCINKNLGPLKPKERKDQVVESGSRILVSGVDLEKEYISQEGLVVINWAQIHD